MRKLPAAIGTLGAMRIVACLVFVLLVAASPSRADAPLFEFHAPSTASDPRAAAVMRDLAERLLPVYQEPDPDRYLANLSMLQMVAGNYTAANASRESLRDRRRSADARRPAGRAVIFDLYAHARAMEADDRISFAEAFTKSYREVIARLNDKDAYAVTAWLGTSPAVFRKALQSAFDQQRTRDSIGQAEAVDLIRTYLSFDAYRSFGPWVGSLNTEDDRRRYATDDVVFVNASDGASIAILVIRPKNPANRLPALLEYTIRDSPDYARESAAHGYVGVVARARGDRRRSGRIVPYQHDGDDARAVVNWIARQPWSDGRVGMYGEGYSGFTAWAAAKRVPTALKAIATSASSAPGIGAPMQGSIFQNAAYRWSLHVTDPRLSDDGNYADDALWQAFDQKWYASGRRYRDLGRLFGKPNPIFIRWLNHPSYDRFWQKMVPYREEFAHITIPVLTMTGYYAGSEPSDLYYFTEHHRYNPRADHTLVVGPYEDSVMQYGPAAKPHGLQADAAALIDLHELRFQWFDHVLKGAEPPSLLKDRVNYQVAGSNEWRHAPSLEAMATESLKFYLSPAQSAVGYRLMPSKGLHPGFVRQTVSLTDRSDAGWIAPTEFIGKSLATRNGLTFVSDPLKTPVEFDGLFSGRLDFTVNKMDMDLNIVLYELLATGDYVRLFSPAYEFRASYARDRVHRHLLKAGERQALTFKSERLTSRLLQAGSRLVMVLSVNKQPNREINYGTGQDVSEESIADGKTPLNIRWYGDSYIEVPVRR